MMLSQKDVNQYRWKKDAVIRVGDNLYLQVRKSSKTYIFRRMVNGKVNVITVGSDPVMKLAKAKDIARGLGKRRDISDLKVSELVDKYWDEVVEPESKVPKQVEGYLNHIKSELGSRKVIDVTKTNLVAFIQIYSKERGARSSDRLRSYLKQIFNYGVELGVLDVSQMTGVSKRITGYRPVERDRILSKDEIKDLWHWRNASQGWQKTEENVRVIKFLLLTGLRISEAQKGYIDGDKFRIDDSKNGNAHWVYLTNTAKMLLPLPSCTATNIQAWLKRKLIKENVDPRYTPHDCRRTFATLANELGVMPHIVEKCLNHTLEGVASIYNHAEHEQERIECALTIERHINSIASPIRLVSEAV